MNKPERMEMPNPYGSSIEDRMEIDSYNKAWDAWKDFYEYERAKYRTLVCAVLTWWEEHKYDTVEEDVGDGYREDFNTYDEPPAFVQLAVVLGAEDREKEEKNGD